MSKSNLVKDHYTPWEGRPLNEVFQHLGEEKAAKMYDMCIEQGMSKDDAWMQVYSIECSLDD